MTSSRTLTLFKQVKISLLYKVFAMFLSFYAVRLSLDYLGINNFGIWSVILSILNWIVFFDFGIANGVKNKVAQSRAVNNVDKTRALISTGYIALFAFCFLTYSLLFALSSYIDWQAVFSSQLYSNDFFVTLIRLSLFFILFNFWLTLINQLVNAYQQSSLTVFSQFCSLVISVILLLYISNIYGANLLYMALIYGVSISTGNLIITFKFFKQHQVIRPYLKSFSIIHVKSIFALGGRFFILQLIVLFILSTDKILIANLLGVEAVSSYEVIYRYFSLLLVFHTLINAPLWPMYTDAYYKKDYKWLLKSIRRLDVLLFAYLGGIIILSLSGEYILSIWIDNEKLVISFSNFLFIGGMIIMYLFYTSYAYLSNGIEKTKLQLYAGLFGAGINIPLTILFVKKFNMGINGVALATSLSFAVFAILGRVFLEKKIKKEYLKHITKIL